MKLAALKAPGGLDNIVIEDRAMPTPGPGEVLMRVHATSLNNTDLLVARGVFPNEDGAVLMHDGAGEIAGIGEGVSLWQPGDKVICTFLPGWLDGDIRADKLGGKIPSGGFGAEYVCVKESALTRIPDGYSSAEAATLPCAALTAWRAVVVEGKLKPGDWVLTLGASAVSIFALQFAKALGAKVIATSSTPEKLDRLKALGADMLVNYKETPDWGMEVAKHTCGGADIIVETGGPASLNQSLMAARIGGHISFLGVFSGQSGEVNTGLLMGKNITLKGIAVGSRQHQMDMITAIETHNIKPVIDRCFSGLDSLKTAFEYQMTQKQFGKIVVTF